MPDRKPPAAPGTRRSSASGPPRLRSPRSRILLDDDLYDRRLGRFNAALKRLLRAPAPGAAALAAKLDLLAAHEAWELTGGELCLAAMARDAQPRRRLNRRAA